MHVCYASTKVSVLRARTVSFPAFFKGIELGSLRDLIRGIPIFYSLRIVNAVVWWVTFVEWLFSYNIKWGKTH